MKSRQEISHDYYVNKTTLKACSSCKVNKPLTEFHRATGREFNRASQCKECRREKYPYDADSHKRVHIRHRYGLEIEDYFKLLEDQGGSCKICKSSLEPLCIDHSHSDGQVRGLLCRACNTGIGHFKDNVDLLKEAIKYLEDFNGEEEICTTVSDSSC